MLLRYYTHMKTINPSDDKSLSCDTLEEPRDSLLMKLRSCTSNIRHRCRRFARGWRKGQKAHPSRAHHKFYKAMHLWSLPIYAKSISTIRHVPYRQASSLQIRKSDHGLFAHLSLRGELNLLKDDPAASVKAWRNRFDVLGQNLELSDYVSSLAQRVDIHTQNILLPLSHTTQWTLLLTKMLLSYLLSL